MRKVFLYIREVTIFKTFILKRLKVLEQVVWSNVYMFVFLCFTVANQAWQNLNHSVY